jgi:hypothetical protein
MPITSPFLIWTPPICLTWLFILPNFLLSSISTFWEIKGIEWIESVSCQVCVDLNNLRKNLFLNCWCQKFHHGCRCTSFLSFHQFLPSLVCFTTFGSYGNQGVWPRWHVVVHCRFFVEDFWNYIYASDNVACIT